MATKLLLPDTEEGAYAQPAIGLDTAVRSAGVFQGGAALSLLSQLSELARHLHTRGLSLSGLKPSNVFLTASGVVVVDVHLAQVLRALLHTAPSGSRQQGASSRLPVIWADVSCLPPELRRAHIDRALVASSSVYAAGAVTLYACTGVPVYPVADLVDALMQHKSARARSDQALRHWASTDAVVRGMTVLRLVQRCLRRRPGSRPGPGRLGKLAGRRGLWRRRAHACQHGWDSCVTQALEKGRAVRSVLVLDPGQVRRALVAGTAASSALSAQDEPTAPEGEPLVTPWEPPPIDAGTVREEPEAAPGSDLPAGPSSLSSPSQHGSPTLWLGKTGPTSGRGEEESPGGRTARSSIGSTPLKRLWTFDASGPLLAAPLIHENLILIVSGNRLHGLSTTTGTAGYTSALPGTAESTPVIHQDLLWFALREGLLVGIHPYTGQQHASCDLDGDPGFGAPIVVDDRLWTGTGNGTFQIYQPRNGTVERRIDIGEPLVSTAVCTGRTLWVPTERSGLVGMDVETGETQFPEHPWDAAGCTPVIVPGHGVCVGGADGTVRCLQQGSDEPVWQREVSSCPITAPLVRDDDLLLGSDHEGTVIALSVADGSERWRTPTDGDGSHAMTVRGGIVHAVGGAEHMWRLNRDNGHTLDRLDVGGHQSTGPVTGHGLLYVALTKGLLHAWGPPG
ncbi:PQQ-binding-like beta-propeller repeat protein [Streptomyces sp. NPDC048275]|uniref:outer membrane protein assembly factor BamB family protein n=1 Tax=Streptomyces sp. NPDC048275 TaxID=3155629 RepID=UPI0033C137D0